MGIICGPGIIFCTVQGIIWGPGISKYTNDVDPVCKDTDAEDLTEFDAVEKVMYLFTCLLVTGIFVTAITSHTRPLTLFHFSKLNLGRRQSKCFRQ